MQIDFTGGKHAVRWLLNADSLITVSTPTGDYDGCTALDVADLRVGGFARYRLPDTERGPGKVVELRIPITHIHP